MVCARGQLENRPKLPCPSSCLRTIVHIKAAQAKIAAQMQVNRTAGVPVAIRFARLLKCLCWKCASTTCIMNMLTVDLPCLIKGRVGYKGTRESKVVPRQTPNSQLLALYFSEANSAIKVMHDAVNRGPIGTSLGATCRTPPGDSIRAGARIGADPPKASPPPVRPPGCRRPLGS